MPVGKWKKINFSSAEYEITPKIPGTWSSTEGSSSWADVVIMLLKCRKDVVREKGGLRKN